MITIPTISTFDTTKIPEEGKTGFREKASYVWTKMPTVAVEINQTVTAINSLGGEITAAVESVTQDKETVSQIKTDTDAIKTATKELQDVAKQARDEAVAAVASLPDGTVNDEQTTTTNVWSAKKTSDVIGALSFYTKAEMTPILAEKQAKLVNGVNIKTVNNESILGNGNIEIKVDLSDAEIGKVVLRPSFQTGAATIDEVDGKGYLNPWSFLSRYRYTPTITKGLENIDRPWRVAKYENESYLRCIDYGRSMFANVFYDSTNETYYGYGGAYGEYYTSKDNKIYNYIKRIDTSNGYDTKRFVAKGEKMFALLNDSTANCYLWKTENGGKTWETLSETQYGFPNDQVPTSARNKEMLYQNGRLFIFLTSSNSGYTQYVYSDDFGETWIYKTITTSFNNSIGERIYATGDGNNQIMLVSTSGRDVAYSTNNGVSFSYLNDYINSNVSSTSIYNVKYRNGKWFVFTNSSVSVVSYASSLTSPHSSFNIGASTNKSDIAYKDGVWYLACNQSNRYYSTDLSTWKQRNNLNSGGENRCEFFTDKNGKLCQAANGSIISYNDEINFWKVAGFYGKDTKIKTHSSSTIGLMYQKFGSSSSNGGFIAYKGDIYANRLVVDGTDSEYITFYGEPWCVNGTWYVFAHSNSTYGIFKTTDGLTFTKCSMNGLSITNANWRLFYYNGNFTLIGIGYTYHTSSDNCENWSSSKNIAGVTDSSSYYWCFVEDDIQAILFGGQNQTSGQHTIHTLDGITWQTLGNTSYSEDDEGYRALSSKLGGWYDGGTPEVKYHDGVYYAKKGVNTGSSIWYTTDPLKWFNEIPYFSLSCIDFLIEDNNLINVRAGGYTTYYQSQYVIDLATKKKSLLAFHPSMYSNASNDSENDGFWMVYKDENDGNIYALGSYKNSKIEDYQLDISLPAGEILFNCPTVSASATYMQSLPTQLRVY